MYFIFQLCNNSKLLKTCTQQHTSSILGLDTGENGSSRFIQNCGKKKSMKLRIPVLRKYHIYLRNSQKNLPPPPLHHA
jgi:hypothetical protein